MENLKYKYHIELNEIDTIHFDRTENKIIIGFKLKRQTFNIDINLNEYLDLSKNNLRNEAKKILIQNINEI